jgi:hypothetical protein
MLQSRMEMNVDWMDFVVFPARLLVQTPRDMCAASIWQFSPVGDLAGDLTLPINALNRAGDLQWT